MSSTRALTSVDLATLRIRNARTWSAVAVALHAGRRADALHHLAEDVRLQLAEPVAPLPARVTGRHALVSTWQGLGVLVRHARALDSRITPTADPAVLLAEHDLQLELRSGMVKLVRLRVRVTFRGDQVVTIADESGPVLVSLLEDVLVAARRAA